jgi:hypothetical protein
MGCAAHEDRIERRSGRTSDTRLVLIGSEDLCHVSVSPRQALMPAEKHKCARELSSRHTPGRAPRTATSMAMAALLRAELMHPARTAAAAATPSASRRLHLRPARALRWRYSYDD